MSWPDATESARAPVEPSSHEWIETQLSALEDLESRPLSEHADVFQRLHSQLQSALAEVDGS
ncbi:MAG: hypothetical protein ACRDWT_19960 [Jatrophihabitantaceae bacterium]